jgi:cell division septum initiation protein DivIVA
VRQQEFPVKLQGVDPEEVYAFRNRLADEVAALHREVAVLYQENHRLRETLHKWRAEHGRACDGVAEIYPNIGFW